MARKAIRRSQAVVPFGVGAIVDLPGESLMSAGLDVWPDNPPCLITDDRLARRLGVSHFRCPPPSPKEGQQGAYLPFVRFPRWHFCPRCRALSPHSWNEPKPPRCSSDIGPRHKKKAEGGNHTPCSALPERRRWRMVPVRFVLACEQGHIDDFPWLKWAHRKAGQSLLEARLCNEPKLRLNYSKLAGLGGLKVVCENCNSWNGMQGAAGKNAFREFPCAGKRPWLGPDSESQCSAQPMMIQRGATNLYFPKIASAILIPPFSDSYRKHLDDRQNWEFLTEDMEDENTLDMKAIRKFAKLHFLDEEQLAESVKIKLSGFAEEEGRVSEQEFRYKEYRALQEIRQDPESEFVTVPQDLKQYDQLIETIFEKVVLVEKLAETRALTGFSRLKPPPSHEHQPNDQLMLAKARHNWLPAFRVFGEGIFLRFRQKAIDDWLENEEVQSRYSGLRDKYQTDWIALGRTPREFPLEFFLIHTIAHVLIRRLSFECGYGSSSVNERIYSCVEEGKQMAGVLIYTAAGDSEGSMGGLVQQGKPGRLESLIKHAVMDSRWCSSDPLCIESRGQGIGSLNLAACHACTLLPETSCEEGNRFLDRAAIVGTPENPEIGFLSKLLDFGIQLNGVAISQKQDTT